MNYKEIQKVIIYLPNGIPTIREVGKGGVESLNILPENVLSIGYSDGRKEGMYNIPFLVIDGNE